MGLLPTYMSERVVDMFTAEQRDKFRLIVIRSEADGYRLTPADAASVARSLAVESVLFAEIPPAWQQFLLRTFDFISWREVQEILTNGKAE